MSSIFSDYRLDNIGFGSLKLYQDPSDFSYGVDAVILADFAAQTKGKKILDIGCGNGIIPLILSHKTTGNKITGIEKKKGTAELAALNVKINKLNERIDIKEKDILDFDEPGASFDTVVTNPPYVAKGSGIVNNCSTNRMMARHETTAELIDFIRISSRLLINRGEFYMVHRPSRIAEIITGLSDFKLEPKVIRFVSSKKGARPNIMLIKSIKNGGPETDILEPLYVYNDDGSYTDEIMRIYERV